MRATVAALLAAATLAAMPVAADVIWLEDDVVWPGDVLDNRHRQLDHLDRDDSRIDEVFPVKHRCSEVPVLIHAQRRTLERMNESCSALKWADDRFHALMQTNPGDAVASVNLYGHVTTVMEMFVLDRDDPKYRDYLKEFWNEDRDGVYFEGITIVSEGKRLHPHSHSVEVHEYIHHLQFAGFVSAQLRQHLPIWLEGFATFMQFEYVRFVLRNDWYGPVWTFDYIGWEYAEEYVVQPGLHNLPHLATFSDRDGDQWQDLEAEYTPTQIIYYWGAWVFRFLAERHPAELVSLKEMFEDGGTIDPRGWDRRIHGLLARLNDDWHDWHEAPLSVADAPEPIVLIEAEAVMVDLSYFFRTINELAFEVSPGRWVPTITSSPDWPPWRPNINVRRKVAAIVPYGPGMYEFTITATSNDGESAELPFSAIVVERLDSSEIVIRDPLSLEEGRTVVYLRRYFNGPEDIAFTAKSANAEVATVAVTAGGWLVLTAISSGQVEITVRATSGQQNAERTFTVVVNDECPPWLCRDFLSSWRKALVL